MQNSLAPSLDLSGKLIIKVQLGDDIRRIPIHNEDITYDELVLMMQRVYRGKLSTNDDIVIKYRDEDGDLITIFDSSDLTFAIQCSRILKITLFVNGLQPASVGDIQSLRRELQMIRDRVNAILDRIEPIPSPSSSGDSALPDSQSAMVSAAKEGGRTDFSVARPVEGKEFDPLSTQRSVSQDEGVQSKVASSFGITNDASAMAERAGAATPDSISSVGSASSSQQRQQQQMQQMQSGAFAQPGTPVVSSQSLAGGPASGHNQQQQAGPVAYTQGGGQAGYPGQMTAPYSQPGAPGVPVSQQQQHQQQQQFPGYHQSAQGGYGHGQFLPGQPPAGPQPGQYGQPGGPQAQPTPPQPQSMYPGGQPYMQQAPGQKFPGFSNASPVPQQSPSPTPGANPYSRGPGYGAGYPRPATNYQQGYQ
ncbi:uncharacterized protein LOC143298031 [Babylonia areolata]|uniref:uncharacterized protein LOC143298031 n=1 Tax=Babylonia areolata TaxID=304850 RepID=UPI003FD11C09